MDSSTGSARSVADVRGDLWGRGRAPAILRDHGTPVRDPRQGVARGRSAAAGVARGPGSPAGPPDRRGWPGWHRWQGSQGVPAPEALPDGTVRAVATPAI